MHITKKDISVVLGGILSLSAVGLGCWHLTDKVTWPLLLILAVAIVLTAVLEVYRRLNHNLFEILDHSSGLARDLRNQLTANYRQTEALLSLYQALKPEAPFPNVDAAAAAPDVLNYLVQLIFKHKPALVVEAGSGLSTLVIAYALKRLGGGRLISLEHDKQYADYIREIVATHKLESKVSIYDTPLKDQVINGEAWPWYDLSGVPLNEPIGIFFVDGPVQLNRPQARYPALPLLRQHLSPDAIILMDDAARKDEREIVARWQAEFAPMQSRYLNYKKGACVLSFQGHKESRI